MERLEKLAARWDSVQKQQFRRQLRRWYRSAARELPWRNVRDPYAIWVSEIMLQQTQVTTVIPYYRRFLERFPTVAQLARAKQSTVLRLWEGLGYYRRAKQLQAAAKHIVREHQGVFPTNFDEIRALPGIGRYTAGAIASFAFDARVPILEGNTIRLHSRLLGHQQDVAKAQHLQPLWAFATELLPRTRSGHGEINQALMELGGQVCRLRAPLCLSCPVSAHCAAFQAGQTDEIPYKSVNIKYEKLHESAIVIFHRQRVLLRKCHEGERWAGLWDFPRFATTRHPRSQELEASLFARTTISARVGRKLTTLRHAVTRYQITLNCYEARLRHTDQPNPPGNWRWVALNDLDKMPLSVTGRKISILVSADQPAGDPASD